MNENDFSASLSETMKTIMSSPEISDIISTLSSDSDKQQEEQESGSDTDSTAEVSAPAGGISIPPDLLAKLPSVLSALTSATPASGNGSTSENGAAAAVPASVSGTKKASDTRRKALLNSLRPYLNPHRRNIVDNLLRIEGLSGLITSIHSDRKLF